MNHYTYRTKGTCSQLIDFDLDNGVVKNVVFTSGCNGNLKAIGKLVEGKDAAEIRDLLLGNTCGYRDTSCADQLAKALGEALEKENA
ncbi:MAG: TIGR03905 family TSCPD domain-containing protein [Lachnospiraceae bacterium]|nr:TIGR03905 family TSCPD domain-containing protein [Lachnospiraceae bacterium]